MALADVAFKAVVEPIQYENLSKLAQITISCNNIWISLRQINHSTPCRIRFS